MNGGATHWLAFLSNTLYSFQEAPSNSTRCLLLEALEGYRIAVGNGLEVPRVLPPSTHQASTKLEWWEKQLKEGLSMFLMRPGEDRMQAMSSLSAEYITWRNCYK